MKITIKDIKYLPYFFPNKNIRLTRYSYWRDYDYIDSLPNTRKKPKTSHKTRESPHFTCRPARRLKPSGAPCCAAVQEICAKAIDY